MNNVNVQAVNSMNNANAEVKEPEVNVEQAPAEPTWTMLHAAELVSSFSVVLVLLLAFGALSWFVTSPEPPWLKNSMVVGSLVAVLGVVLIALCFFAWQAVRGEQIIRDRASYVLSDWSLKTLIAAGLPADLSDCLIEILLSSKAELTVHGGERTNDNWLGQLEAALGKPRVAEYEEMLFKYTARENREA